jgi:two-component system LytT family response regulator
LKVNRSCIVNLDFVESMTPDDSSQFVILLRDGSRFTASRDVSKELRSQSL